MGDGGAIGVGVAVTVADGVAIDVGLAVTVGDGVAIGVVTTVADDALQSTMRVPGVRAVSAVVPDVWRADEASSTSTCPTIVY